MSGDPVSDCCRVEPAGAPGPTQCPGCRRPGRKVQRITVKALIRPETLARLSAPEHRFCATSSCPVVYFGGDEVLGREDVLLPVFQKEPAANRTVCYCFAVTEGDIRRELEASGRSTASERIAAFVKADRCACEVRNPQGACCLGNVLAVEGAAGTRVRARKSEVSLTGAPFGKEGMIVMRMLAVACLAGLLNVVGVAAEVPKKSCCAAGGTPQQGETVKPGKLRCSLTGKVVDSCCCVERQGKTHCTLADKDVETCCCEPVAKKAKNQ